MVKLNRMTGCFRSRFIKRLFLVCIIVVADVLAVAQAYNAERIELANFLTRMYKSAPFEGVKVIEDYNDHYLMSTVVLDPAKYNNNLSAINRVASVKSMSQASRFFNGSEVSTDMIIRTSQKSNGDSDVEILETIKENSVGYVQSLEQLTNFKNQDGWMVYIFITPINISQE